jgi:rod shape-determining protein MreC
LRLASKSQAAVASEALMLKSKFELARAIDRLQTDNFELMSKISQLAELEKENASLRAMASIAPRGAFKPVYAEVIARDPASWYERFTIGRGSADGLAEGDLVVSPTPAPEGDKLVPAVVGRVRSVSHHTASVEALASEDCKISVKVGAERLPGLLEGAGLLDGMPIPSVKCLPLKDDYAVGALVLTSGFSPSTPADILVGRLCPWPGGGVVKERDHIYAEARLLPAANFDAIRFVSVFTRARR